MTRGRIIYLTYPPCQRPERVTNARKRRELIGCNANESSRHGFFTLRGDSPHLRLHRLRLFERPDRYASRPRSPDAPQ